MRRTSRILAVAIVAAVAASAGMVRSGPVASGDVEVWYESFDYVVELNGHSVEDARLFTVQGRPRVLLTSSELEQALVLDLGGREVKMVEPGDVDQGQTIYQVTVNESDIHGPPIPYTLDGDAVVFFVKARRVKIIRKPPLVGEISKDQILDFSPVFEQGMLQYEVQPGDLHYLRNYELPVQIEVYFGSWCPHCKKVVPMFMRLMEDAANSSITWTYTGVPHPPFSDYPPAKARQIRGVPTFVVTAGQQEIGRIDVIPQDSSLEHELVRILYVYEQQQRGS